MIVDFLCWLFWTFLHTCSSSNDQDTHLSLSHPDAEPEPTSTSTSTYPTSLSVFEPLINSLYFTHSQLWCLEKRCQSKRDISPGFIAAIANMLANNNLNLHIQRTCNDINLAFYGV